MRQERSEDVMKAMYKGKKILEPELYCQAGRRIVKICREEKCKNSLRCDVIDCKYCGISVHSEFCSCSTLAQLTYYINERNNSYYNFVSDMVAIDREMIKEIEQTQKILTDEYELENLDINEEDIFKKIYKDKKTKVISGKDIARLCRKLSDHNSKNKAKIAQLCSEYKIKLKNMREQIVRIKENLLFKFAKPEARVKIDSCILKMQGQIEQIKNMSFLQKILNNPIEIRRIFNSEKDGFKGATFHAKCDNVQNTLILVQTEFGRTIGGFTQLSWSQDKSYIFSYKKTAFLFSLDLKQLMTPQNHLHSLIFGSDKDGPVFGQGHDLFISDECNLNSKSYANFPTTFNSAGPDKYINNQHSYTAFTGAKEGCRFRVINYEAFKVIYQSK